MNSFAERLANLAADRAVLELEIKNLELENQKRDLENRGLQLETQALVVEHTNHDLEKSLERKQGQVDALIIVTPAPRPYPFFGRN